MASEREAAESARVARRRRWVDPRFAIGIVLVLVSVLGVVGLVNAANASVAVLAARTTLTPGERVHASDLLPTSVRVGRTASLYLQSGDVPPAGIIVTRAVAAGELVPHSAVGSEAGTRLTSVVVSVNAALAASITAGTRVDLWSARQAQDVDPDDTAPDNTDPGEQPPGSAPSPRPRFSSRRRSSSGWSTRRIWSPRTAHPSSCSFRSRRRRACSMPPRTAPC
ncbi:MAG: hypothetical protein WDM88_06455 [Galbitalea sp.]